MVLSKIFKNRTIKEELVKEKTIKDKMIKGKLINNNSNNLVIVFQAIGVLSKDDFEDIINNRITQDDVSIKHQKYSWFKLSEVDYADYFFIEDHFSDSYGWYMIDSGESIIDKFNKELEQFIIDEGYETVTAFGSSKGGSGALLYGLINPRINRIFSLVPQIHPVDYIDEKLSDYKTLFFPMKNPKSETFFNNIFFNEKLYVSGNHLNTKVYLYTGVGDEQYKPALEFNQFLTGKLGNDSNIIINTSLKKHNPIVLDNVPFVKSALKLIANDQIMKGPRLSNVRGNILLLKDK